MKLPSSRVFLWLKSGRLINASELWVQLTRKLEIVLIQNIRHVIISFYSLSSISLLHSKNSEIVHGSIVLVLKNMTLKFSFSFMDKRDAVFDLPEIPFLVGLDLNSQRSN